MYIWNIVVNTRWSYHDIYEDGDKEGYDVSGKNFEHAYEKVKKIALSKKNGFKDDETQEFHYPIGIELISVQRGVKIDG